MKSYATPLVLAAVRSLGADVDTVVFEAPRNPEHGDLSTNVAMTLAKQLKKAPRQIAEDIVDALDMDSSIVTEVSIAGPGFINFKFSTGFYGKRLHEVLKIGDSFGRVESGTGKTVNVEYVSANPTGLLHLGHGRNAAVGDTVANILDWNGYDVTREYYFNNAGNQMTMLAKSIHARYMQMEQPDFPMPENGYMGPYIAEIAAEVRQKHGDGFKELSSEHLEVFRSEGEQWCTQRINITMESLGIHHDVLFNEDTLYTEGKIDSVIQRLRDAGYAYDKDGAVWLKLSELGLDDDRVIVKSTGEPTYRLPDIAYHITKLERGFDVVVDIFGPDHIATIPDVMAGCRALGFDDSRIRPLIYQIVALYENGQQVKMSKRTGKSYTLDDLIEELGADVVRFFFIMRGITTPLDFDLDLAREQSDKNPAFYLQYAHARICSVFAKAEVPDVSSVNCDVLQDEHEIALIQQLLRFPEIVERAGRTLEPVTIVEYLREAAASFHRFYHFCPILKAESEDLKQARLALCVMARIVIRNGLSILGISAPNKM